MGALGGDTEFLFTFYQPLKFIQHDFNQFFILFSVAIKYGFNVSHLKNAVCYQMGFDAVTEAAPMEFFYLFSLCLLGDEIGESDKKKINMTLSILMSLLHRLQRSFLRKKSQESSMFPLENQSR